MKCTEPAGAIGVVVPARDEETSIEGCLAGLHRAAATARSTRVTVVVVLDSCLDRTGEVAEAVSQRWGRQRAAPGLVIVQAQCANVGVARALGFDMLARLWDGWDWWATTDADSVVPAHWLTHQSALRAGGADAWLGTVTLHALARPPHDAITDLHGLASHPHVHGANLGLTPDAYARCGGFAPLATGEDVDLARRLLDGGWRVVSGAGAPVRTSGRLVGRAPAGFASDRAAGLPFPSAEVRN